MSVNMRVLLVIGLLVMISVDVSEACDSYTVSSSGSLISSTNFPDNYPDNEDQCWTFTSSSGADLMVEFYDFETESTYDDVTVYDGLTIFDTVLDTLSGLYSYYDGYTVYSTGQNMRIRFKSDGSINYQGFQACVCAYSYTGCSCDLSGNNSGLAGGVIAGIVIGVLLFISIPIIIIVACCCCCGGKTKGTTQSNNTYAARRARGELLTTNRAGNPDRKHNQVRPAPGGAQRLPNQSLGPQPPPYTGYQPQQTGVILTPTTLPHGGPGPAAPPYGGPGPAAPPYGGPGPAAPPYAVQPQVYPPPPVDAAYPPPPPASYVAPVGPGPNGPPGQGPAGNGPSGQGPAGN